MKTILVPTDGSATADAALDVAIDLAQKHGAGIRLLHVLLRDKDAFDLLRLPDLATAGAEVTDTLDKLAQAPRVERLASDILAHPEAPDRPVPEELLRQIAAHVLRRAGGRAEARGVAAKALDVADGAAAPAIVAVAERDGIDTIVIGMRGLRQIEAVTLGSVSQEVCQKARCTCIAVHSPR